MTELPTMAKMARTSAVYDTAASLSIGKASPFQEYQVGREMSDCGLNAAKLQAAGLGVHQHAHHGHVAAAMQQAIQTYKEPDMRIVRVYIADTNKNIPLDKRIIYTSEEKLTDLSDQDLFYELPINEIVKAHNEYRATLVDQDKARIQGMDRGSVMLDPVRVSGLKMVVVDIVAF